MILDVKTCYMAGTVLGWAMLPDQWPAFAAWAERTLNEPVTEATRQEIITAALYFGSLAETMEAAR